MFSLSRLSNIKLMNKPTSIVRQNFCAVVKTNDAVANLKVKIFSLTYLIFVFLVK